MIREFERAGHWLARIAQGCGAAVLMALVVLTCADVVGRYLLAAPINGKTELTRMMMAVLIALVLPVVTFRGEHITVDLFDHLFRGRAEALRDLIVDCLAAGAFIVLAYWVAFRAMRLMAYGYVSDFLRLPLHPVAFLVAGLIAIAGLVLVVRIGIDVARLVRPDGTGDEGNPSPPHRG